MRRKTNQHERKKKVGHAVQISLGPDNWNKHNQQKTKKKGQSQRAQTDKKKEKTYDLAEHFLVR